MYRIGITGGIASGKTTLAKYLAQYQYVRTINMDLAVHKLYECDYLLRKALATRFGNQVLIENPNGTTSVNRTVLGKLVFESPEALRSLNAIVHPPALAYMQSEVASLMALPKNARPDLLFVEGAVLIEAGWVQHFDELWLTKLRKELAVQRVIERNKNLSIEEAKRRIESQITDEERASSAHFAYDTEKPFAENVLIIQKQLKRLAKQGQLRALALI